MMTLQAQQSTVPLEKQKQQFEKEMNDYITTKMKDQQLKQSMIKSIIDHAAAHDHGEILDAVPLVEQQLKHEYIVANIEAYKRIYFPAQGMTTYPEICDNGGFENDFLYYTGEYTNFWTGSSTCEPKDINGNPVVFVPITIPNTRQFEIVSSGIDPIVGLQKTKFGNKALKINDIYGAVSEGTDLCLGYRNSSSCNCSDPDCFKIVYIPKPDCSDPGWGTGGRSRVSPQISHRLAIVPNPVYQNEFTIQSTVLDVRYEIIDMSGRIWYDGIIKSTNQKVSLTIPAGVYILKYHIGGELYSKKFVRI